MVKRVYKYLIGIHDEVKTCREGETVEKNQNILSLK